MPNNRVSEDHGPDAANQTCARGVPHQRVRSMAQYFRSAFFCLLLSAMACSTGGVTVEADADAGIER